MLGHPSESYRRVRTIETAFRSVALCGYFGVVQCIRGSISFKATMGRAHNAKRYKKREQGKANHSQSSSPPLKNMLPFAVSLSALELRYDSATHDRFVVGFVLPTQEHN